MLKTAIPILASLDAKETIDFYTCKLGFKLESQWDGYLIFSKDETFIHLWATIDPEVPKATGCYIRVTEVDSLFEVCGSSPFSITMATSSILARITACNCN